MMPYKIRMRLGLTVAEFVLISVVSQWQYITSLCRLIHLTINYIYQIRNLLGRNTKSGWKWSGLRGSLSQCLWYVIYINPIECLVANQISRHIIDIVYTMIMVLETCTDAIQNQDEMGIDCGGTCPESCGMKLKYLYHTRCK